MNLTQRYRFVWKPLVFAAALVPLASMALGGLDLAGQSLGADPVKEVLHRCGKTALNLLLITLCVSPLARLAKRPNLLRVRRMLGLFAFFYAVLHLAVYVSLELGFNLRELGTDIVKRPYITIGCIALLLLVPLAFTSTQGWMRRLGRRWQTLHALIYPVSILAVWHFWWQVKADIREPLLYALGLALLLGYRLIARFGTARPRSPPATTSTSGSATAPGRT